MKKLRKLAVVQRKVPIILIGLVFVAALAAGIIALVRRNTGTDQPAAQSAQSCSDEAAAKILVAAIDATEPLNQQVLEESKTKIEAIDGYQQDPNCMYVITLYHIQAGDSDAAASSLEVVKKVYKPEEGFNEALKSRSAAIDILEKGVQVRSRLKESYIKSTQVNTFPSVQ